MNVVRGWRFRIHFEVRKGGGEKVRREEELESLKVHDELDVQRSTRVGNLDLGRHHLMLEVPEDSTCPASQTTESQTTFPGIRIRV